MFPDSKEFLRFRNFLKVTSSRKIELERWNQLCGAIWEGWREAGWWTGCSWKGVNIPRWPFCVDGVRVATRRPGRGCRRWKSEKDLDDLLREWVYFRVWSGQMIFVRKVEKNIFRWVVGTTPKAAAILEEWCPTGDSLANLATGHTNFHGILLTSLTRHPSGISLIQGLFLNSFHLFVFLILK